MSTIDVAIFGSAGYGGQELLHLLNAHPHFSRCLLGSHADDLPFPAGFDCVIDDVDEDLLQFRRIRGHGRKVV